MFRAGKRYSSEEFSSYNIGSHEFCARKLSTLAVGRNCARQANIEYTPNELVSSADDNTASITEAQAHDRHQRSNPVALPSR